MHIPGYTKQYDRYLVDGREWQIGEFDGGRIEVFESPRYDDHPLRKTARLLLYPNQLRKALKNAENIK